MHQYSCLAKEVRVPNPAMQGHEQFPHRDNEGFLLGSKVTGRNPNSSHSITYLLPPPGTDNFDSRQICLVSHRLWGLGIRECFGWVVLTLGLPPGCSQARVTVTWRLHEAGAATPSNCTITGGFGPSLVGGWGEERDRGLSSLPLYGLSAGPCDLIAGLLNEWS
jgi:hypothetical protein